MNRLQPSTTGYGKKSHAFSVFLFKDLPVLLFTAWNILTIKKRQGELSLNTWNNHVHEKIRMAASSVQAQLTDIAYGLADIQ